MRTTHCPLCDFNRAEERTYEDSIERDGKSIVVRNLRHFECPNCRSVFVNDEQSRHNLRAIQAAFGEETKFLRPEVIREWRNALGITQRELSRLLGGGLNAISKYENGEVVQSEPMDNLLWLVMRFPGLLAELAERRKSSLPDDVAGRCGRVIQASSVSSWAGTLNWEAGSLVLAIDGTSHSWWTGARALFLDGSWSRRGLTYSSDESDLAANDKEFRFAQLA